MKYLGFSGLTTQLGIQQRADQSGKASNAKEAQVILRYSIRSAQR